MAQAVVGKFAHGEPLLVRTPVHALYFGVLAVEIGPLVGNLVKRDDVHPHAYVVCRSHRPPRDRQRPRPVKHSAVEHVAVAK